MDADGVIRYANAAFEEMTGYTAGEAIGQSAAILASGSHPDAVFADMWKTLRAGKPFRFVFSNRRKDGSPYDEGAMVSPFQDPETGEKFYMLVGRLINFTRQNYDVFTILANSAPAGIYLQRDGVLYFINDRLAAMLGRHASELIGSQWAGLIVEEDRERVVAHVEQVLRQGSTDDFPLECRIHAHDGVRWVMASVQPLVLTGPTAVSGDFTAGYVVDITARKLAEERVRNAISLHAATIESTTDGIVVIDSERNVVSHNRRFVEMWKLNDPLADDPDEMRRIMASQLKDPAAFHDLMVRTRQEPAIEEMVPVDLIDGRHMEMYSKPQIVDGNVLGRVWSWRDVTERRRFESALIRLANYDSLTGLMNRRKIQEELEACLAESDRPRGALLLLDLDGFKEVNDTFGHQAGDEVLLQVARVLADSDLGDLIGRFGGDEFAVLLPGLTPAQAMQAAERTLHYISDRTFVAGSGKVSLTGSMGVAFYPGHATTSDELLSAADLALYEAKSQNDSSLHVYSPRLQHHSRLQRRGDWQTQLRNAISNSKGRLYAEKTLPLHDKGSVIYRLSIRMTGPRTRVLSSRDLGALAHQASLTLALDRWLLREAISLARRPSFIATVAGLSFDLSVHSLAHPDVVRRLLDLSALRAVHDCPLVLELTDLDAVANAESAIASLRSAGYRFEVPDCDGRKLAQTMGTLPIDYLRLDSALIGDLDANLGVLALIEGALHTAQRLGATSVADSVPDHDILSVLRDLGLDYARGPAVGPARSANTVFKIARRMLRAA
jgi:diguanylate cyclase (GGDEF)-like protein/PAS domain S-box-containing protein